MATVPDTHDFLTGVVVTSEDNTYIRDPIRFLLNKPIAELRQTSVQTLTTSVAAAIALQTADIDTDPDGIGGHDPVTNNSRYTARYAGWYDIAGAVTFASNATSVRHVFWRVNGTTVNGSYLVAPSVSGDDTIVNARAKQVYLNVGDYVELWAIQFSGGNLSTVVAAISQSHMSVKWGRN